MWDKQNHFVKVKKKTSWFAVRYLFGSPRWMQVVQLTSCDALKEAGMSAGLFKNIQWCDSDNHRLHPMERISGRMNIFEWKWDLSICLHGRQNHVFLMRPWDIPSHVVVDRNGYYKPKCDLLCPNVNQSISKVTSQDKIKNFTLKKRKVATQRVSEQVLQRSRHRSVL